MQNYQAIEISDLSGGFTDFPLVASPNEAERLDNFLINDDKKPITRPGSVLFDISNPQPGTGSQRINAIINILKDQDLVVSTGPKLFRYVSSWTELTGSTGNQAFGSGTGETRISSSDYKGHTFLASTEQNRPLKIYKDQTGTMQLRTAGLPAINTEPELLIDQAITLANELKSKLITHFATTATSAVYPNGGYHYALDSASAALITASNATDKATMLTLTGQLLAAYALHASDTLIEYRQTVFTTTPFPITNATKYHLRPERNTTQFYTLNEIQTPLTFTDARVALNDLKQKFNRHQNSDILHYLYYDPADLLQPYNLLPQVTSPDISAIPTIVPNYDRFYQIANSLKRDLVGHLIGNSDGVSAFVSAIATVVGNFLSGIPDASDFQSLQKLVYFLGYSYNFHVLDALKASFWVQHLAQGTSLSVTISSPFIATDGLDAFPLSTGLYTSSTGDWDKITIEQCSTILRQLIPAYLNHDRDSAPHTVAANSLHQTTINLDVITNSFASSYIVKPSILLLGSYAYSFHYDYQYYVKDLLFEDLGPVIEVGSSDTTGVLKTRLISAGPISIINLPILNNGLVANWDTSNIKIYIYRTSDGGTNFNLVGSVTNGTTTFVDTVQDGSLTSGQELYTTGGAVSNDPPPAAKYLHVVNGFGYYGDIRDDFDHVPNRVRQSIQDDIDSCPQTFFVDLPYAVQGISSVKELPLVFTKTGIYRLEGSFDELGRGSIKAVALSESIGLINNRSIVQIDYGLIFAGNDGFYFTDGYQLKKITEKWNITYQKLIQNESRKNRIYGTYDKSFQRCVWSACKDGDENDTILVLHMRFDIENQCYTTWSGGTNFIPTAIVYFNNQLIRGSDTGYVFKHDFQYLSDPKIDITISPSLWAKKAIIFDMISPGFDGGTTRFRKWVTGVKVKARNVSNLSLAIFGYNDNKALKGTLTPIRNRSNLVWGDTSVTWGDTSYVWNLKGIIYEKRKFPGGTLRCGNKQVQFTNATVNIENSDTLGLATIDPVLKTITLVNTNNKWNADSVDFTISFLNDNYTQQFTITSLTNTVLTVSDSSSLLPIAGNYKWQTKGIPKNEKFELLNYEIEMAVMGDTQVDAMGEAGANS